MPTTPGSAGRSATRSYSMSVATMTMVFCLLKSAQKNRASEHR